MENVKLWEEARDRFLTLPLDDRRRITTAYEVERRKLSLRRDAYGSSEYCADCAKIMNRLIDEYITAKPLLAGLADEYDEVMRAHAVMDALAGG